MLESQESRSGPRLKNKFCFINPFDLGYNTLKSRGSRYSFPTEEYIYSALVEGGAMLGGSDDSKLSERARTISEPLTANCAIAQIDSRGRELNCAVRLS